MTLQTQALARLSSLFWPGRRANAGSAPSHAGRRIREAAGRLPRLRPAIAIAPLLCALGLPLPAAGNPADPAPAVTPAANAPAEPQNFVRWRPGLASSAQPPQDYLARAKALGYDMVINLAPPQYSAAVENESAILARAGVAYVSIPVDWGNPTPEDFRLFTEVMNSMRQRNVLVHCQVNLRGTAFVFLYRVLAEGAPIEESRDRLTGIWMPNPVWRKFIDATLAARGKKVDFF